ncbi:MAG: hypothetical protein FWF24_05775 [Alphaproteobacteria bacterium]|nr:hypothetical protein [Alphaproteobacteria bacterium]
MKKLCLVVMLLSLGGCASDGESQTARRCPQVAILRALEALEDFGDATPSPETLVAAALMEGVEGTCLYSKKGLEIVFDLSMRAYRGPALQGGSVTMPFFVAVVDSEDQTRSKQLMTASFSFKKGENEAQQAESLRVFLPLLKGEDASSIRILMGFQLTQAQLEACQARLERVPVPKM